MTKKQKVQVLQAAARYVMTGRGESFCCNCIGAAMRDLTGEWHEDSEPYRDFRSIFFKDAETASRFVILEGPWWGWDWENEDTKEARIFALLLTTELIRTNSLP